MKSSWTQMRGAIDTVSDFRQFEVLHIVPGPHGEHRLLGNGDLNTADFPGPESYETDSISTFWERGMVCKVSVEIVVSEKLHYRARILEGRSEALPREVHAILSAHDLAKNKVLQFDYKKRIITITDSKR